VNYVRKRGARRRKGGQGVETRVKQIFCP
jgi:hypothetical protein